MRFLPAPVVVVASLALHAAFAGLVWRAGRAAAATAVVAPPPPGASIAGETFEVPEELPPGDPTATTTATATTTTTPTATATATPTPTATAAANTTATALASASSGASAPPSLFGAVGVRYAVDLLQTFTRSLPQAASADAQWASVPLGAAGDADFTLEIDDAGVLRHDMDIRGAPSAALRAGITRTVALIGGRAFTARAARSHLRVSAIVTADTHEDEYHGSRFALTGTGSCEGNVCKAFFALPIGRRIDFTLRVLP